MGKAHVLNMDTKLLTEYEPEIFKIRKDYIYDAAGCLQSSLEMLNDQLYSYINRTVDSGLINMEDAYNIVYVRELRGKIEKIKLTLENLKTGELL